MGSVQDRFVPMTPELCEASRSWIVDYRLSAGDAVQLESARMAQCDAFLSADDRLLAGSAEAGLVAVNARMPDELRKVLVGLGRTS